MMNNNVSHVFLISKSW